MQKIILIYPYFDGLGGAYNRYLLLEKLIKICNIDVKFILLNDKSYSNSLLNILFKVSRFFKIEALIF